MQTFIKVEKLITVLECESNH